MSPFQNVERRIRALLEANSMLKLVVNNEEKSPVARLLEIGALLDLVPIGESHLSTSAVVKMESEAYRLVRLGRWVCLGKPSAKAWPRL